MQREALAKGWRSLGKAEVVSSILTGSTSIRGTSSSTSFAIGYAENAAIGAGHLDPGMHVMTQPFAMGC